MRCSLKNWSRNDVAACFEACRGPSAVMSSCCCSTSWTRSGAARVPPHHCHALTAAEHAARLQDKNKLISPTEFGHLLYAIFGYSYKKARKDSASVSLTLLLNALYSKWHQVGRCSGLQWFWFTQLTQRDHHRKMATTPRNAPCLWSDSDSSTTPFALSDVACIRVSWVICLTTLISQWVRPSRMRACA